MNESMLAYAFGHHTWANLSIFDAFASLPEERLAMPIPAIYDSTSDDGSGSHAPIGIRLAQVVQHGTDHRSQICTALTTLGVEPPEINHGRTETLSARTSRRIHKFWNEGADTRMAAVIRSPR
jgi:uncharacterized damage-inducible protein DinB